MSVTINFHLNKSSRTKKAKEIAIIGRVSYSYLNEEGSKRESFKFGTGYSTPARGFKAGRVSSSIANASHINSKLAEYAKRVELLYYHGKNAEIDHLISLESDHPFSHQIDHPFLPQIDHPLAGR